MAYIDKEMAKRKGEATDEVQEEAADPREALYGLAERYQVEGLKVDSDDEGNVTNSIGMLSAIPEIDLGMENRLRNIEETERAKRELIETRKAEASAPREDDPLAGQRCELAASSSHHIKHRASSNAPRQSTAASSAKPTSTAKWPRRAARPQDSTPRPTANGTTSPRWRPTTPCTSGSRNGGLGIWGVLTGRMKR